MNDMKRMELSEKSTVDQKTAQLPLEQGKASPLPYPDGEKVVSERILRLANEIVNLTIFEVADLNSTLKKKLDLPDAPVFAQSFATSATSITSKNFGHKVLDFQTKNIDVFKNIFLLYERDFFFCRNSPLQFISLMRIKFLFFCSRRRSEGGET